MATIFQYRDQVTQLVREKRLNQRLDHIIKDTAALAHATAEKMEKDKRHIESKMDVLEERGTEEAVRLQQELMSVSGISTIESGTG